MALGYECSNLGWLEHRFAPNALFLIFGIIAWMDKHTPFKDGEN
jgi:hypothetical protein